MLCLSFFNSEHALENAVSSCLSHRAGQPAWGEIREGRGPNWYVIRRMLLSPTRMGITVTPASANAQNSRQPLGFFLSPGHSPHCCVAPHQQSPLSKSCFSQPLTAVLDLCSVPSAGVQGSNPTAPPWSADAGKGPFPMGPVTSRRYAPSHHIPQGLLFPHSQATEI